MRTLNEEKGFVLLTAILIMFILTLVGLGAILNSSVEINISRNERLEKQAFFAADAGSAIVPRIITYYMTTQPAISGYPDNLPADIKNFMKDANFLNEINATAQTDDVAATPDIQVTGADQQVNIDVDWIARVQTSGQDIVFLNENGVTPPVMIFYRNTCRGFAPDNSFTDVELFYRYIPPF